MNPGNVKVSVPRVLISPEAAFLLQSLKEKHGPLLFHQSGGCCDGSAPMCFTIDDFKVGSRDVLLGQIEDTPFYMAADQFEFWKHTQLIIDCVPGRGASFSLEIPTGYRFIIKSRIFSDNEIMQLENYFM